MSSDTPTSSIPPLTPRREGECMVCYTNRCWKDPQSVANRARTEQIIAELVENIDLEAWGLSSEPVQCDPNDPEVQRLKRYMDEMKQHYSQMPRSTSCSCTGDSS